MTSGTQPRILIIGAGSVGIITGYHLQFAGADITFLVRPHRAEALNRPQVLYSYDDNTLKEYTGYSYFTSPTSISSATYNYIVITLDAAALRNDIGQALVKIIGDVTRGTDTKVVLGVVVPEIIPWFLRISGLRKEQVTNGLLAIHAYSPQLVKLPVHEPTDEALVRKADQAYTDKMHAGFMLADSAPAVANGFKELWDASGASKAAVMGAQELATMTSVFAVFAGSALLDWPPYADIGSKGELWGLTVEAVKEIQSLAIHGDAGMKASEMTTEEGLAAQLAAMEQNMLPMDLQAFNKYTHGGKLTEQDRGVLEACVEFGEGEGKGMNKLKELMRRVEARDKVKERVEA